MIPVSDVTPEVPSPLPQSKMPVADEITEEGFGFFRGTWFIGRVRIAEALATISEEAEIIHWLDEMATSAIEFEQLASAIEQQDPDVISEPLRAAVLERGGARVLERGEDAMPLDRLEIGVAGLTYALAAVRCLTAACCRSHTSDHSWSDVPVVLFAAPQWRAEILAELAAVEGCGIDTDRDLLSVYGRSIRDTNRLASHILAERGRFTRMPERWRTRQRFHPHPMDQLSLPLVGLVGTDVHV